MGEAVQAHGWLAAAFNLFDVSAIVWLAIAAGWLLAGHEQEQQRASRADWLVASGAAVAALVPVPPLSAAMLTAVAGWFWWTSPTRSQGRRAAAIFLSLSTFFFWGRIFLALGAGPLLSLDTRFVGFVSGMAVHGNVVSFADGGTFIIAPGCSSLHGISLALILWTAALGWFDLTVRGRMLWTLVLAVIASILVNGVRLAMIAWNPRDFDYWHIGLGASMFGWLALILIAGIVYRGVSGAMRET